VSSEPSSNPTPRDAPGSASGLATQPPRELRRRIDGATDWLVEVRALEVSYSGVHAVAGVSMGVRRGEIVGLIGPNGAGKSSALNAISGDVHATRGSVYLGGRDVTKLAPFRRARLGMARTSQTARVFEGITVFEGLMSVARGAQGASLTRTVLGRGQRAAEAEAEQFVWETLDQHGFTHIADLYGRELSGGQRRFVDLAMALIRSPRVLLLDEPMVGVAPALLPNLMDDVRRVADRGVGILMVEHALDVVSALCDRVIVMAAGKVIAEGTYEQIAENGEVRRAYLS
jgi:branched-chain amino acid transport system ATP-binding protein